MSGPISQILNVNLSKQLETSIIFENIGLLIHDAVLKVNVIPYCVYVIFTIRIIFIIPIAYDLTQYTDQYWHQCN